MPELAEAISPILDRAGIEIGRLTVASLPNLSSKPPEQTPTGVQLLEASTYRFGVELDGAEAVELEPSTELFSFDSTNHQTGRFTPGQNVGTLVVEIRDAVD